MRDALKRARQAVQERPLVNQISDCKKFITAPVGENQCRVVAELAELKAKLVATERERDEALCAPAHKRQAMSRTAARPGTLPSSECSVRFRLKEDHVPMCDEDILRWMQDRQADMQDALSAGRATRWQGCATSWAQQRPVGQPLHLRWCPTQSSNEARRDVWIVVLFPD